MLELWRDVLTRWPDSTIENLSIGKAAPGRFVRTARLRHDGPGVEESLEYEILKATILRKGRVVRQVNELVS